MLGMISILNEAKESYNNDIPVLSDEQYRTRLNDLKEFEEEMNTTYLNSPNCNIDLKSLIQINEIAKNKFKECNDISEIIEYSNQKELVTYIDVQGIDMIVSYYDGYLSEIQIPYMDEDVLDKIYSSPIPYKINKSGIYTVKGVMSINKNIFYVNDVAGGDKHKLKYDLSEAIELGFNAIPYWSVVKITQKNIENVIQYVLEYAEDEGILYNRIAFRFDDIIGMNFLNYIGCHWAMSNK